MRSPVFVLAPHPTPDGSHEMPTVTAWHVEHQRVTYSEHAGR